MTDPTEFSFGTWVRRRRKALDLTQAALANQVGCAEVSIRKLEADAFRPSYEIAERLAICLEIPADDRKLFLQVARTKQPVDRLPPAQVPAAPAAESRFQYASHLDLIPANTIPAPAPLAAGSRMPLSRNPLFTGREASLCRLAQIFKTGETAAIGQTAIAAVTGLGGIGKTQLACEFVHRYGQFFPGGVLWLSFADPAAVPAEVAACGGADGMQLSPEFGTLPLDEQLRRVQTAWQSSLPRLLIFDNCEDESLLDKWRPKYGGCRVLITSRRHHWDLALGVQLVPLDVLPRQESLALLWMFRSDLPIDDANLNAIAEALGDLPLALHLAGSFLAKYRRAITPTLYLHRLLAPTILDDYSLRAAGLSPTKHLQHVARTFERSYEHLDPADPADALALKLLAYAAHLAPGEPIPRWLMQTLTLADGPDTVLLAEDALTRLIDLGLLQTDGEDSLRLHRLLVAFVRAVVPDTEARTAVEEIMLWVVDDLNQRGDPRPVLALQSHLRFIADAVRQDEDMRVADLCNKLGYHLWMIGDFAGAQHYHERALAIQTRLVGMEHADTALSLCLRGLALFEQGNFSEAQRCYKQAFFIWERVLGMEHSYTAWSLHGLATILRVQGHYDEAQRYYEHLLAIRQRVVGADHPDTAWSLSQLGLVLYKQGDFSKAQRYHEQALAIRQRLGPDHPLSALSLSQIGLVLYKQGKFDEARHSIEQALAIQTRVVGMEHPDTARSLFNLGMVLHAQGKFDEARSYLEPAVAVFERRLGPQHPKTLAARGLLAILNSSPG